MTSLSDDQVGVEVGVLLVSLIEDREQSDRTDLAHVVHVRSEPLAVLPLPQHLVSIRVIVTDLVVCEADVLKFVGAELAFNRGVPVVFDVVVSSSWEKFAYQSPPVAVNPLGLDKGHVFLLCPLVFLDIWIEVVVPSLATLFAYPAFEVLGDFRPVLGPFHGHQLSELLVLLVSPHAFDQLRIQYLLPSMQTLDIRAIFKVRTDFLPVFRPMLFHKFHQFLIFLRGPVPLLADLFGWGDVKQILVHDLPVGNRLFLVGELVRRFLLRIREVLDRGREFRVAEGLGLLFLVAQGLFAPPDHLLALVGLWGFGNGEVADHFLLFIRENLNIQVKGLN